VPDGVLFGSSNSQTDTSRNHRKPQTRCRNLYAKVLNPMQELVQPCIFYQKTEQVVQIRFGFMTQADGYTLDDKRSETKDNDIADIMSLPQFGCRNNMHR
jgi:type I restriction enzyme M protein